MKSLYIFFACAILSTSSWAQTHTVSLAAVLSDQCKWSGKTIATSGFVRFFDIRKAEHAYARLFLHQDDAEHTIIENSVLLVPSARDAIEREKWDGKYVTVIGPFDCQLAEAHEPGSAGGFPRIDRVLVLDKVERNNEFNGAVVEPTPLVVKKVRDFVGNWVRHVMRADGLRNDGYFDDKEFNENKARLTWALKDAPNSVSRRIKQNDVVCSVSEIKDQGNDPYYLACFSSADCSFSRDLRRNKVWSDWSTNGESFCLVVNQTGPLLRIDLNQFR